MYSSIANSHSSFSSSPPSSPNAYIDSSSPASSPGPDGCKVYNDDDDDDDDIPMTSVSTRDPFSASRHHWKPPSYEKKKRSCSITSPRTPKKPKAERSIQQTVSSPSVSPMQCTPTATYVSRTQEDLERDIWEEAGARMVDDGYGCVSLENKNLTRIPETFIDVISNFFAPSERSEADYLGPTMRTSTTPIVTRPLHRASTEPTVWGKPVARTQSVATIHLGLPKNKIQLFLSHNNLSVLPSSLFRAGNLENLTVLSLRNNNLTYLPPEINRLIGLEEFSVGQNRIQYLPAEMLQMKLKSLHLIPNPFMTPPPSRDPHSLGSSTVSRRNVFLHATTRRQVSKTTRITGSVPSLAELLLRFLLSPVDPMTPDSQTMLEAHYELPIPEEPASHLTKQQCPSKIHFPASLPPFVRSALNACLPGSVYLDEEPDSPTANRHTDDVTGIGMCPSPLHQRHGTPRLFVMHAEERYTWEAMVAGVEMGGSVPVRWRGCKQGCLDFLNPSEKAQLQLPIMDPENGVTESPNDDDDPMGVVQMVQLAPAHSEDFDDE